MASASAQIAALMQEPAGKPPEGVQSNLVNPPNLKSAGRGVLVTCLCLATLALALRIYSRVFLIRRFRISDYSLILAWGVFAGYFVPSWLLGDVAPGVDQWNLTLQNFETMLYYGHIGSVMYGVCIFFLKLSILLQYLEIFVPTGLNGYMYWSSHTMIWVLFIFYFISTFLEIFSCRPIAKAWNPLLEGTCLNTLVLNVAASSINSATDLIILILPQVAIWKLRMSVSKRLSVSAMFFIGILACVSSIVRLTYAVLLYKTTNNVSYYFYLAGFWTLPEMGLGIVVACLPTFPKLAQSLAKNPYIAKLGYSLQSFIGRSSLRSQKTTDSYSMGNYSDASSRPQRPVVKGYEKWDDDGFPLVVPAGNKASAHMQVDRAQAMDV